MRRVFYDKISGMNRHAFEHWQHSVEQWKKVICHFKLKNTARISNVDLTYYVISLEDTVTNVAINNPSAILSFER